MTTYSTYQECKIANPECEIVVITRKNVDEFRVTFEFLPVVNSEKYESGYKYKYLDAAPRINDGYYDLCNPADYCITVDKFLADGHKFVDGDLIYSSPLSKVIVVSNVGEFGVSYPVDGANSSMMSDNVRYILRAAALEKPFLQTGEDFEHSKTLNFIRDRLVEVSSKPMTLDCMRKLNNAIAFVERMEESSNLCGSGTGKEEKPKRTKVSYEKRGFEFAWCAIKAFEDGEKLYTKLSSEEFVLIDNAPDVLRYLYDLHESVETEITDREEFIDEVCAINEKTHGERRQYLVESLFDSGRVKLIN